MDASVDHYVPRESDIAFLEIPILRYLANCGTINPHVNRENLARILAGNTGMYGVSSKEAEIYRKLSSFGIASCYKYTTIELIIDALIQRQKVVYKATGNLGLPANSNGNSNNTNTSIPKVNASSSSGNSSSSSLSPYTSLPSSAVYNGGITASTNVPPSSAYQALRGNMGTPSYSSPYASVVSSSQGMPTAYPRPSTVTNNYSTNNGPRRAQDGSIVSMNYRSTPATSIPLSAITTGNNNYNNITNTVPQASFPSSSSSSSSSSSVVSSSFMNHNYNKLPSSSSISSSSTYPQASSLPISSSSTNSNPLSLSSSAVRNTGPIPSHNPPVYSLSSSSSSTISPPIPPETLSSTLSTLAADDMNQHSSSSSSSSSIVSGGDELSTLTEEQLRIYKLAMDNHSIFFTGSAGTGKSHLLRLIIKGLKAKFVAQGRPDAVIVTAPTGIAACNIGGVTIHSFAGIGRGNGNIEEIVKDIKNRNYTCRRWRSCHVLVIDEVSMLDGELFDKLEYISRKVRCTEAPFGGIQLIIAGDFFQLPPVGLDQSPDAQQRSFSNGQSSFHRGGGGAGGRGRGGYRGGHSSYGSHPPSTNENHKPVKFCFEANCWNQVLYAQLSLRKVFRQSDSSMITMLNEMRLGRVSDNTVTLLSRAGSTLQRIEREHPELKPTKLFAVNSWVDKVNDAELEKCPGEAIAYNAVDSGDDMFVSQLEALPVPKDLTLKVCAQVILLKNIDPEAGLVNGARGVIVEFRENPETEKPKYLPFVEFTKVGDTIPVSRLITPAEWTIELGNRPVATRTQLPLKCAWALSIHKSQGMTIDLLEICLSRVFEFGQAYVALSRAVSLDRLRVTGFQPNVVKAHPRVLEFYHRLMTNSANVANGGTGGMNSSSNGGGSLPRSNNIGTSSFSSSSSVVVVPHAPAPSVPFSNVSLPLSTNLPRAEKETSASTSIVPSQLSSSTVSTTHIVNKGIPNPTHHHHPPPPPPPVPALKPVHHSHLLNLWSNVDDDIPDPSNDGSDSVVEIIENDNKRDNDDDDAPHSNGSNENYPTGKRTKNPNDGNSMPRAHPNAVNRPFKQPRRADEE